LIIRAGTTGDEYSQIILKNWAETAHQSNHLVSPERFVVTHQRRESDDAVGQFPLEWIGSALGRHLDLVHDCAND
jgi:hypothetical protein